MVPENDKYGVAEIESAIRILMWKKSTSRR
jgi:hypothetical protein